jgi:two-component system, LytTR family, sensor kinase
MTGDPSTLTIIPLVLLTLLENAFKHGELNDKTHPLSVQLFISNEHRNLYFNVTNKKRIGPREKSTSIGIENTRRRLYAAYAGAFKLETRDEGDFYTAILELKFNRS